MALFAKPMPDGRILPLNLDAAVGKELGLRPYALPPDPRVRLADLGEGYEAIASEYDAPVTSAPAESYDAGGYGGSGGAGNSGGGGGYGGTLGGGAPPERAPNYAYSEGQGNVTDYGGAGAGVTEPAWESRAPDAPSGQSSSPTAEPLSTIDVPGPGAGRQAASPYPPRRVVRIPQKDMKVGWQVRKGQPVDEESLTRLEAEEAEVSTLGLESKLRQADAAETALADTRTLLLQRRADAERRLAEARQEKDRRDAAAQEAAQAVKQRSEAARRAAKLEPKGAADFWEEKGTFAKVMSTIALALGAGAQGLRGLSSNPIKPLIDQQVDDWVDTQRIKYEELQRKAEGGEINAKNEYAQAMALYGDARLAEQDLQLRAYDTIIGLLENRAQQIANDAGRDQAIMMAEQLDVEQQQRRMELEQAASDQVVENWARQQAGSMVVGGAPQADVKKVGEQEKYLVRLPDGRVGITNSANAASMKGKIRAEKFATRTIGEIRSLLSAKGTLPATALKARLTSKRAALKEHIAASLGMNVNDEFIENYFDKAVPDATSMVEMATTDVSAALGETSNMLHRATNIMAEELIDPQTGQPLRGGHASSLEPE